MAHSQDCLRQALGAAVQQSQMALGAGLFAAKVKRVGTVLDDLGRLAEKLVDTGRVDCLCPRAEQRRLLRSLAEDRRTARVANGAMPR